MRKMPLILVGLIACVFFANAWIPVEVKREVYAISLLVKSAVIFMLPCLIFMLLFKTVAAMSRGASRLLGLILLTLCLSNFVSTMIAYCVGHVVYHVDIALAAPAAIEGLSPSWVFTFPRWISNDYAMFLALALGFVGARWLPEPAQKLAQVFDRWTAKIFKVLTALVPVFVLGFIMKLIHD
ncbi:MAG: dicarboxylate/amino acid:cation symporter, partial [Chlamydiae bacterium]|nr:dicarboxylate/amino acid:cation symporter [Chlamydiota bacterium]